MIRIPLLCLAVLATMLVAGCGNTRVASQWRDPQTTSLAFGKLFVVAPDPTTANRRIAEDVLVGTLSPTPAVVSYQALPEAADIAEQKKLMAEAQKAGADGVLVMRVVADDTTVVYESYTTLAPRPRPYPGGYTYYGRPVVGWTTTYVDRRRVVTVETNIFRASDGVLLWTGVTRTAEPQGAADLVQSVVTALRKKWKADKLPAP